MIDWLFGPTPGSLRNRMGEAYQTNECKRCGMRYYGNSHYCGSLDSSEPGCTPVKPLTEDDVRKIVREELARALQKGKSGR